MKYKKLEEFCNGMNHIKGRPQDDRLNFRNDLKTKYIDAITKV